MSTSVNQQTELEKAVTRVVYFVELDFASGVQRLSTAMQTIAWGGHDWIGLGTICGISAVKESGDSTPRALNFTVNAAQQSWLALASGPVEEYRGRPAKLYMCPLNVQFQLIDTPIRCWTGKMQTILIGADEESGQITLNCETSAFDLRRASSMRLSFAQHKERYPSDEGLKYHDDLKERPHTWLSKLFQQI